MATRISFEDIRRSAERIKEYVHRTPVVTCATLDQKVNAHIFLKCENLQKAGAFKFRGACNAVLSLTAREAASGVATHSSGNHAQALALAARMRGIVAHIVMPYTAPIVKKAAVMEYGGKITFCESTLEARERTLAQVVQETNATVIHPYNDYRVIAGQGTASLELLEDIPHLDVVMAPVGGGGLLSGTAIATKGLSPETRVIGAEPEGADDAYKSLQRGTIVPQENPKSIADGLLTSLGDLTFPIIREHVEQIVTVSEEAIIASMKFMWERTKIIIEPSAAVPIGALWERKIDLTGLRIGIIMSGGNVDLDNLPWKGL
jgi:threonine dehydratase